MAKASIRDRLEKLDRDRRFLDWFVLQRFLATLTLEELETWASSGGLPDPIPNRPSSLDTMDRKSLRKLWEEEELIFQGRSKEEHEFYATMASGQSREVGSTILKKTANSKLNGERRHRKGISRKERKAKFICELQNVTAM